MPSEIELSRADERSRLTRDTVLNYSGVVASGVLGFVSVPFLLRGLGADGYGSWIAALALASILGAFDFGMEWALTREVAEASSAGDRAQAAPFVRSAALLYGALGLAGGVLIGCMGVPLSHCIGTQSTGASPVPGIFGLAALSFCASHFSKFSNGVLEGMQKFDCTNALTVAAAVLRSLGTILLVTYGASLWPIAVWYTSVGLLMAVAGLLLVACMEPRFLGTSLMSWPEAREHFRFGFMSQTNALFTKIVWESGPVLLGTLAGSGPVVALHVGQRFPSVLSLIGDRVGGVIFSSAGDAARDVRREAALLQSGTRTVLAVAIPACALFWVFAPALLKAWIPGVSPTSVTVARIGSLAVLLDAFGTTAVHILWGKGRITKLTAVSALSAVVVVVVTCALATTACAVGAAIGFVLAIAIGTLLSIRIECRDIALNAFNLVAPAIPMLLLALTSAACARAALAIVPDTSSGLVVAGALSILTYGFGFFVFVADTHEKHMLRRFASCFAVPMLRR